MPDRGTSVPGASSAVFDEEFYLTRYPGVAEAVKRGEFTSGLHHYKLFGAREGRIASGQTDDPRQDLMLGFCSLGKNCEFGVAQRIFGAEPLDLFRWALTPSDVLVRLLRARFEHIGDPSEIEVYPSSTGEYHIRHRRYHFAWHAWANVGETTPERLRDREAKRLPFLARKLMQEMADEARVFVVAQSDTAADTAKIILTAMHAFGRPTLMYVTDGGPLGVAKEGDYLLHATIPRFADESDVPATLASGDWLTLCEQARGLY